MLHKDCLGIIFILVIVEAISVTTLGQVAKKVQVELRGQEIFAKEPSGQWRQLTRDGRPKEHIALSPSGSQIIYHTTFDPYKSPPEPLLITAINAHTGKTIWQIPVKWAARFVSSIEWINDHLAIVRGEAGFASIVNSITGKQTHNLFGADFKVSPDGRKIIYHYDFNPRYGPVSEEYKTDYVLISLTDRSSPVDPENGSANFKAVYTDLLPWGEVKKEPYMDLDSRHQIKSTFAWSTDSNKVAFVETNEKSLWLTVLGVESKDEDITIDKRRYNLGPIVSNIQAISWEATGRQIKVSGDKEIWLVNPITGAVRRSQ